MAPWYAPAHGYKLTVTQMMALSHAEVEPAQIVADVHVGSAGGGVNEAMVVFGEAEAAGLRISAINEETNAASHDMARALDEASDLNSFFSVPAETGARLLGRAASFCTSRSGHRDAFDQGLVFFLPNMTWLQPPGHVHVLVTESWLPVAAAYEEIPSPTATQFHVRNGAYLTWAGLPGAPARPDLAPAVYLAGRAAQLYPRGGARALLAAAEVPRRRLRAGERGEVPHRRDGRCAERVVGERAQAVHHLRAAERQWHRRDVPRREHGQLDARRERFGAWCGLLALRVVGPRLASRRTRPARGQSAAHARRRLARAVRVRAPWGRCDYVRARARAPVFDCRGTAQWVHRGRS